MRKTIDGFERRFRDVAFDVEDTFKDISEKTSIRRKFIYNWRTGNGLPSVKHLARFCKTYNVSMDYLLGLSDRREP